VRDGKEKGRAGVSFIAFSSPYGEKEFNELIERATREGRYSTSKFPYFCLKLYGVSDGLPDYIKESYFWTDASDKIAKLRKSDPVAVEGKIKFVNFKRWPEPPVYEFEIVTEKYTIHP
jgi:hypothetical protein